MEGSDEGEILAVLEQKNDMVGTARRIEGRLKFVPDDCPAISMTIQRDCEGGAKDGDKVAVEILQRGAGRRITAWAFPCALAAARRPSAAPRPCSMPRTSTPVSREGAGRGKEVRGHDRV